MAKNQRRRAQEALFSPAPSTTPPQEEKDVERTETALNAIPAQKTDVREAVLADYGITEHCTVIPRLLYAILCEVVRGRL